MTSTPGRRASRRAAVLVAALTSSVALAGAASAAAPQDRPGRGDPDLGPNVVVLDPAMSSAAIQAKADEIAARQLGNQFGTERYALLFKPGTYGTPTAPLRLQVGYYTEVAGLGLSPSDVTINGTVNVYNQCDASGCIALNNFWRSMSNLTIEVAGGEGCQTATEFWAVSQAAPLRRVDVHGKTTLMDYCTGPSYASGGYIADSAFSGDPGGVINGSQQQFYTRGSAVDGWSNGVWNQVFSGVVGAPAQSFPTPPYTTLPTTPVSREKPYLYVDGKGRWNVFVPATRRDSAGTSWQSGPTRGRSVPLSDFYVARPGDRESTINRALASGKDLLLTPGVYDIDRTLEVKRAGTVVLGTGLATLTAQQGAVAMRVADVPGVDIAGVTFDAGPVNSPALLVVGKEHGRGASLRGADPIGLQDVFFRIGGPHLGRATTSLVVNSDGTLLDDIWAWRADHGTDPADIGWTRNTADTGVVVNGDDVTATGLLVEHYQKYNVIWNGERGRTVFFQNELPYDAPDQASWQHDGVDGWAAYKVADTVRTHEAWGLGSYIFTNVNRDLHATNAFEVPLRSTVRMHDLVTVSLNDAGTIDHVINGVGEPARREVSSVPSTVVSYP